jgi:hypothetical protein
VARERLKAVLALILIFVPVTVAVLITAALGGSGRTVVFVALTIGLLSASGAFVFFGGKE